MTLVKPERFPRRKSFFFAGEQHRFRVAQHAIFCPRPVQPFLYVLQRIFLFEPRVQHAVWINYVGSIRITQSLPRCKAMKLPNAVDSAHIVPGAVFPEPRHKPGGVSVTARSRTKGMDD